MKNAGMAGAVALVGIGLITIGLSNFQSTTQAHAAAPVAAAINQGPEEPTIVWYDTKPWGAINSNQTTRLLLVRAWSDGTIEARSVNWDFYYNPCAGLDSCEGWVVISSPNDGLAALSDLNDDAVVDVNDLLKVVDDWGPAPPNVIPPSDCPLAMINP